MRVIVETLTAAKHTPRAPVPNGGEHKYISSLLDSDKTPAINVTSMMQNPLNVLTTYEGTMLYCAGGVIVHRIRPTTMSGKGYTSPPQHGTVEDVFITCITGRFNARVKFERCYVQSVSPVSTFTKKQTHFAYVSSWFLLGREKCAHSPQPV